MGYYILSKLFRQSFIFTYISMQILATLTFIHLTINTIIVIIIILNSFLTLFPGKVFYLQPSHKMTLTEAQLTCQESGAEIAKVGQLYSAWRFAGLDHCEAGWLADGSVRYAISRPRSNCGPPEPGVRSFGFPPPQQKYGVYCYKPDTDRE